jgi:hypothetical protein
METRMETPMVVKTRHALSLRWMETGWKQNENGMETPMVVKTRHALSTMDGNGMETEWKHRWL